MKLIVDSAQRYAKMRAHTATHLLHAALGKIFPTTKQAGSLVDSDLLRFDFYADRLLNEQELAQLERVINQMIYYACEVSTLELSLEEAQKLGAKMFFEEKYGDIVRVVQVKNIHSAEVAPEVQAYFDGYGAMLSQELCWGTHVANTKDIGAFSIVSQEAVASGIKRLTALTGPRVLEKLEKQTSMLWDLVNILEVKSFAQLSEKAQKLTKTLEECQSQLQAMESKVIKAELLSGEKRSDQYFEIILKVTSDLNFKTVWAEAKSLFLERSVLLYNDLWNFIILWKSGVSAKQLAQQVALKWWGNDVQIQWRDENVLKLYN